MSLLIAAILSCILLSTANTQYLCNFWLSHLFHTEFFQSAQRRRYNQIWKTSSNSFDNIQFCHLEFFSKGTKYSMSIEGVFDDKNGLNFVQIRPSYSTSSLR